MPTVITPHNIDEISAIIREALTGKLFTIITTIGGRQRAPEPGEQLDFSSTDGHPVRVSHQSGYSTLIIEDKKGIQGYYTNEHSRTGEPLTIIFTPQGFKIEHYPGSDPVISEYSIEGDIPQKEE